MSTIDFSRFAALTFDCYGTLIDWEAGILAALDPLLAGLSPRPSRDALIAAYARHEREAEAGPYRPYREVLAIVLTGLAREFGFPIRADQAWSLADSLPSWPAFAETPAALARLKSRYRLAILSNIDNDLFDAPSGSRVRLGVPIDVLVTAQEVRSYKPGRAHFDEGRRRLDLSPDRVLHIAESRFHDVTPASALGFATVWVNRRGGKPSASGEAGARADFEVPDLSTLVALMGL
jgi:2-haloacid dehalogenase